MGDTSQKRVRSATASLSISEQEVIALIGRFIFLVPPDSNGGTVDRRLVDIGDLVTENVLEDSAIVIRSDRAIACLDWDLVH